MHRPNSLELLLAQFRPDPHAPQPPAIQKALLLAARLQDRVVALQTPAERRQQAELDRMLQHPQDKATLALLTDQAFRTAAPRRALDQFIHIVQSQGVPQYFNPLQQVLLRALQTFGPLRPGSRRLRGQGADAPADGQRHPAGRAGDAAATPPRTARRGRADERQLPRRGDPRRGGSPAPPAVEPARPASGRGRGHLRSRSRRSTRRFRPWPATTPWPRSATAWSCSTAPRRTSASRGPTATRRPKFVYLDMEEYRDMDLTAEAFMRTLERPGLEKAAAGIVLQAYIPDSFAYQKRLCHWARGRVAAGGAPITLRIVKGANLEIGTLRGLAEGLAPGALHEQARNRRQLPSHGLRGDEAGERRRGPRRHRLAQPLRPGLRPGAGRRKRRTGPACSSRCSKAWPIRSAAPCWS